MNKQNNLKSKTKTVTSNQFIYQQGQQVMFLLPNHGKVKGEVLGTDYTAKSGYTVSVLIQNIGLMQINERFLQRLEERAK